MTPSKSVPINVHKLPDTADSASSSPDKELQRLAQIQYLQHEETIFRHLSSRPISTKEDPFSFSAFLTSRLSKSQQEDAERAVGTDDTGKQKISLHPSVSELALKTINGKIKNSNARTLALLMALLRVVKDFRYRKDDAQKRFLEELSSEIDRTISFL